MKTKCLLMVCLLALTAAVMAAEPTSSPPTPSVSPDPAVAASPPSSGVGASSNAVLPQGAVNPARCKRGKKGYIYWAAHDRVFAFRFDPTKPIYPRQGFKGHVAGDWIPWPPDPDEPEGCYGNPLRGGEVPYMKEHDQEFFQKLFGRKINTHVDASSHGFYAIRGDFDLQNSKNESNKNNFFMATDCRTREFGVLECQIFGKRPKAYSTQVLKIESRVIFGDSKEGRDLYLSIVADMTADFSSLKDGKAVTSDVDLYEAVRLRMGFRAYPNEIDKFVPYYRETIRYITDAHVTGYSWKAVKAN